MIKERAFTLIELLISLIILAVLASIAYPSFQNFIIQSRRSDAQSELIKAQIAQSNHYILHPTYLDSANSAGLPSNNPYYNFSVISASANTYLMKAEAKVDTSQSNDKDICITMVIDQDSKKTNDGMIDNTVCWRN